MTLTRFAPMLANTATPAQVDAIVREDDWIVEQKSDGHRRAVVVADGAVTAINRRGEESTLPKHLRAAFAGLEGRTMILDAELVGNELWAFDLPRFGAGIDELDPWHERRRVLEQLFAVWSPSGVRLLPYAQGTESKIKAVEALLAGNHEGFIAKRVDAAYSVGRRSSAWLKVKFRKEIDCVVLSLGVAKDNLQLGLWRDGELVEVGEVSRLTGDGPRLKPGDVVTVTLLYVSKSYRLVQVVKPILRDDKVSGECVWEQLEPLVTNGEIIPGW